MRIRIDHCHWQIPPDLAVLPGVTGLLPAFSVLEPTELLQLSQV
jgi:hypothetical protein